MSEANLNPGDDEETKWIEDVLLACHARGTLPSRTYLEKCVEVAERAAIQREDLIKLQEALTRVQRTGSARDHVLDVARAAGISERNAEQALFLREGFLTECGNSRADEPSSNSTVPVTFAAKWVATPDQQIVVKNSPGTEASVSGTAFQNIRAWLLELVACTEDSQTRAGFDQAAQSFGKLISEAS